MGELVIAAGVIALVGVAVWWALVKLIGAAFGGIDDRPGE